MKNFLNSIRKKQEEKRIIIIQKELEKKGIKFDKIIKQNKNKIEENIKVKIPSVSELEALLEKAADKFDIGIKTSRELHENLIFLGLHDSGLKEYHKEKIKQRKNRIKKINKTHKELIETLEENKHLEKRIEIIHEKLNQKLDVLRNKK